MEIVSSESFQGVSNDIAGQIGLMWDQMKAPVILPLLRVAVFLCLLMSVMLFVEKIYMTVVIVVLKLFGKRPEKQYKWEPLRDDLELGSSAFPMVLVQIPMYNEKEVYKLSIGAACGLSWPSDRIIIQVLDDSTDSVIKDNEDEIVVRCNTSLPDDRETKKLRRNFAGNSIGGTCSKRNIKNRSMSKPRHDLAWRGDSLD